MTDFPRVKRMGERAILVEFEPEISPATLHKTLAFKNFLKENLLEPTIEVTSAYNSLLVSYAEAIEDVYGRVLRLKNEFSEANIEDRIESRLFLVPVCYEEQFALDLEEISTTKNLSKKEIVLLHSSKNYLVYFTGFLPGFLYLGGLPEALHFPRRNQPRSRVQKGAVGIGEKQTGIYPQESPGGWNIIGNSPVPLFDPHKHPPCEIRAGDRIRFYPVTADEHQEILEKVKSGNFQFEIHPYDS